MEKHLLLHHPFYWKIVIQGLGQMYLWSLALEDGKLNHGENWMLSLKMVLMISKMSLLMNLTYLEIQILKDIQN